jgi:hypothetical protein
MIDKYLILLCFILIGILFYRQQNINIEKMTDGDITTDIIKQYNNDIKSIQTISNMASQINSTGGITINGDLKLSGKLLIGRTNPYTFDGASNLNISNNTFNYTFNTDGTNSLIPSGLIISWNNLSPPPGWLICDGTASTPDLKGKFILGSNNNLGTTGGTSASLLLTPNIIPQHGHSLTYNSDGYTYSLMDPSITINPYDDAHVVMAAPEGAEEGGKGQNVDAKQTNSYDPSHIKVTDRHMLEPQLPKISGKQKISDVFDLGGLSANAMPTYTQVPINLTPPYYVLIYIMKK